jgi:hypothetical protein
MQPQKAYIINATTSTVSVLLNQAVESLASIKLDPTANNQIDANNWAVPFSTGANIAGTMCSGDNTLQLIGPQYSSSQSPVFKIQVDSNTIPPENSWLFVWVMRRTLVITDQNGNVAGIHIEPEPGNREAEAMINGSPNT